MNKKYFFLASILFLITTYSFGQIENNFKKSKYELVSEAYGYLTGQDYSLKFIVKNYPQYKINITKAQLSFNSSFGKSKEGMRKYLIEFLGQKKFEDFEEKLIIEMNQLFNNQVINEDVLLQSIAEVENRAKGQIPSPILETLLSFQFSDRPEAELLRNYWTVFKTKGHSKSKNTDWQIKVPKSWKAEEADRPNIIQKFRSDYGSGDASIMLIVKEMSFPKNFKGTRKDIDDLFTENTVKEWVPEGGKFISFTKMMFDNNIGGMIELEQISENLDLKFKLRMVLFMFIRENKMYTIQGAVSNGKIDTDLTVSMKKYFPLFKLVASSIVVNDQYK